MHDGSWAAAMVASLAGFKAQGHAFEWAWRKSLALNPPRPLDRRRVEPWGELSLLNQNVLEDPSVVESMKHYCETAWFGEKPELAGFHLTMLGDEPGEDVDTGLNAWAA